MHWLFHFIELGVIACLLFSALRSAERRAWSEDLLRRHLTRQERENVRQELDLVASSTASATSVDNARLSGGEHRAKHFRTITSPPVGIVAGGAAEG